MVVVHTTNPHTCCTNLANAADDVTVARQHLRYLDATDFGLDEPMQQGISRGRSLGRLRVDAVCGEVNAKT